MFEDLSLMQYKTADRKVGLSYQQLKLALEKLAKWHAATALLSCRVNTLPNKINLLAHLLKSFVCCRTRRV